MLKNINGKTDVLSLEPALFFSLKDFEEVRLFKHQAWADRFCCYKQGISKLFEQFAEDEKNEIHLNCFPKCTFLNPLKFFGEHFPVEEHFLVLFPPAAIRLLGQAIEFENITVKFYQYEGFELLRSEDINLFAKLIARSKKNIFKLQAVIQRVADGSSLLNQRLIQ